MSSLVWQVLIAIIITVVESDKHDHTKEMTRLALDLDQIFYYSEGFPGNSRPTRVAAEQ